MKVSNKPVLSISIPLALKERMQKHSATNWSEVARKAIEEQVARLEVEERLIRCKSEISEGWISNDPRLNGCGIYRLNGKDYKIVKQDLVTTSHRVAFLNGIEVARAGKFTTLLKRMKAL